ncbi:MAG: FAD-binding protein, partial [Clostridiales bacterium]|nr:FAD-binding protein [Clostridiales bacterium]
MAGGGSGLIAAVRAAQNGKGKTKVILLEKMPRLGGNTDYAHMFFPVYSRLHAEAGLADLREEAVLEYVKRSGGIIDPGISRACVYGCGDFLDWLLEFPEVRDAFEIHAMGDVAAFGPVYSSGVLHFPKRLHENLLCRDQAIG